MPTYEYRCPNCGFEFEQEQSVKADPLERCPQCKGRVERVINFNGSFIFKGTGSMGRVSCNNASCSLAERGERCCDSRPTAGGFS